MKTPFLLSVFCLYFTLSMAQHKGNYNQKKSLSRQNVAHSGNTVVFNPNAYAQVNMNLSPTNAITFEVKALQNVKASSYTAVFNLIQIGETAKETNALSSERIQNVIKQLNAAGFKDDDFMVDVISFVPVYELEVEKKLFSKKYNEVPKGFELQQNLHIQFTNAKRFQDILTACAENEIYNLVKVDYFIDNIAQVYKNLQTELLKLINDKKDYYKALGFNLNTEYNAQMADNKYCYFPKDFYKNYQAFNSISFEALKKNKGVNDIKKPVSYYYQPITYETYDLVVNPSILEPVVQVGMHIKLQYTPKSKKTTKPAPIPETEHKYYVISPNGTIDIKELKAE